jgi:ssDNA-binding Zn-finger/Zn-ribbon topoisomerase 1
MREIEEIGVCPSCDCSLVLYKTRNYKRFVKCEICGLSYPIPKRGSIENSGLICPAKKVPILIIEKRNNQKAYFWADRPCFDCIHQDTCEELKGLKSEFTELGVYGYGG